MRGLSPARKAHPIPPSGMRHFAAVMYHTEEICASLVSGLTRQPRIPCGGKIASQALSTV
jgi:hypothetical protein